MKMEKNILIIPDVHGRTFWKEALETGKYSKVIFLGDYVDPYQWEGIDHLSTLSNFKDILSLKMLHPNDVVLLLGNHDMSYYSDYYHELAGSDRHDEKHENELNQLFISWASYFQLAHEEMIAGHRYLFSHAGVTQPWLQQNIDIIKVADAEHLNQLVKSDEGIATLAQAGFMRGGGYRSGSIVWADADELAASGPLSDTYQIVGHTMQLYGPIIQEHFACLDCRCAFSLNDKGILVPVMEIPSYEAFL